MERVVDYISMFVGSLSLIMALVLMVSLLNRAGKKSVLITISTGLLFSFSVLMTMSDPIDFGEGGIHDLRGLLIGTAAGLIGPVVGLMTLATGLVMRWTIGGTGMVPGMVAMGLTFAGAMLWRHFVSKRGFSQWKSSALLGMFISLHLLAFFLFPVAVWSALLPKLGPFYFMANVFGAGLISYLIRGELSFLSEAESSKTDANTDHLTGLLNRRGLDLAYPELAKSSPSKSSHSKIKRGRALLYFDIDRFKVINDTHGHAVGDAVLKHITEEVASNLRPNDVFARLGGDEFAVVLSNIDEAEAKRIAQRCRTLVAGSEFEIEGKELEMSISIGAIWMLHHTEIDTILDEADKALYAAKSSGRNKVVFKSSTSIPNRPALAA